MTTTKELVERAADYTSEYCEERKSSEAREAGMTGEDFHEVIALRAIIEELFDPEHADYTVSYLLTGINDRIAARRLEARWIE